MINSGCEQDFVNIYPSKQSATLAQHWYHISRVSLVGLRPVHMIHLNNVGLMLGQRRRRLAEGKPTFFRSTIAGVLYLTVWLTDPLPPPKYSDIIRIIILRLAA